MLTVSLLTASERPFEAGIKFELISTNGNTVLASGETGAQGVISFDVDPASVGPVAIRLEPEAGNAS